MLDARITVVIPVYQGERFLAEAIESVLSQSYTHFNLVVCDDGSTDGSYALASDYARQDSRVRAISKEHSGVSATLNVACRSSGTEFIAILDSDDVALEWRLERQVDVLVNSPSLSLVGGNALAINAESAVVHSISRTGGPDDQFFSKMLQCNQIINSTVMMRRTAFESVGGYRTLRNQGAEDYDLWLRICHKHQAENLDDILSGIRIHSNQNSFAALPSQVLSAWDVRAEMVEMTNFSPNEMIPRHSSTAMKGTTVEAMGDEYKRAVALSYVDYARVFARIGENSNALLAIQHAQMFSPDEDTSACIMSCLDDIGLLSDTPRNHG